MEYYFQIKEPGAFRYRVMSGVRECLLVQREQEKLELIRQAKKDLFKEIKDNMKEIKTLVGKLDTFVADENIKKEIKLDLERKIEEEKAYELQEAVLESVEEEPEIVKKPVEVKKETAKKEKPKEEVKPTPKKAPSVSKSFESDETSSFEYTLDQIEKKLSELRSS